MMHPIAQCGIIIFLLTGYFTGCVNKVQSCERKEKIIRTLKHYNIPINNIEVDNQGLITLFLGECQSLDSRTIGRLGSYEHISCMCARFDLADIVDSKDLFSLDIGYGILQHPERILEFKNLKSLSCCLLRPFEGEVLENRMKDLDGCISVLASKESILSLQRCSHSYRYSLIMTREFYNSMAEDEKQVISRIPINGINSLRSDVFWKAPLFYPESTYSFFQISENPY